MSWRTVYGNNQRNSQAGVGTNLNTEVWNYTFAVPEQPAGPPVVSPNGYVWIMTKDTAGFDFTLFLHCFSATGTLISKQALQYDEANDNTTARLATLSDDSVVVPWTDRQRNFVTGLFVSDLTGLPGIYSLRSNETFVFTTNEVCNWTITEAPAGGSVAPASGTSTTYTAPAGTGTFHVVATSVANPTHTATVTIYVSTVVAATWERTFTVTDTSYVHTDAPCVGATDELYFSYFDDTNGYTHIASYDSAGTLIRDFPIEDAGVFYNCNIVPLTMDAIGFYVAGRQIPPSGIAKTTLLKFDGLGRLLWKTYFGNFSDTVTLSAPSVSANVLAVYARKSAILGWITIHALNPSTGALLWSFDGNANDYANGTHLPAIDNSDMVYGGHFGDTGNTANLRQVDFALGTENWLYTDAADPQDYPTSPVVGNDGHLYWFNGNIVRVKTSNGSEISKITSLAGQFTPPDFSHFAYQPALVTSYLYVPAPGATSGSIHAFSTPPPPTIGNVPRMGIRGIRSVTPYPRDRARATYMGHGFWGKIITPNPVPACALWKAYTKGFVSGEDMSLAAFGLPTEFLVCGPLAANIVYTVQKPMVDPNGAVAGVPLIFKMERDATDAEDTDTNPQSLIAIELIYDKA